MAYRSLSPRCSSARVGSAGKAFALDTAHDPQNGIFTEHWKDTPSPSNLQNIENKQ